jgi:hypothetical protein
MTKSLLALTSNRRYKVAVCDSAGISIEEVTILRLIITDNENNFEFLYAMQDIVDKILDLREGESMIFQPNRDDSNSKGIIYRI